MLSIYVSCHSNSITGKLEILENSKTSFQKSLELSIWTYELNCEFMHKKIDGYIVEIDDK